MKRYPLIAGNWKMNGSAQKVDVFTRALTKAGADLQCDLAVCVPAVYLERLAGAVAGSNVKVGAQNLAGQVDAGALTGEINGAMLADCSVRYVIVGHSERRAQFGETDEIVAAKADAARNAGLTPIVCVGETLEEYEAGETENVLGGQLDALKKYCQRATLSAMVLAYEPIWAIGSGRAATPEQAQSVHEFLRQKVAEWDKKVAEELIVLYGGSVKPDNARLLFAGADVDGALVGGASLEADSLIEIARAVQ